MADLNVNECFPSHIPKQLSANVLSGAQFIDVNRINSNFSKVAIG